MGSGLLIGNEQVGQGMVALDQFPTCLKMTGGKQAEGFDWGQSPLVGDTVEPFDKGAYRPGTA